MWELPSPTMLTTKIPNKTIMVNSKSPITIQHVYSFVFLKLYCNNTIDEPNKRKTDMEFYGIIICPYKMTGKQK